MKAVIYARFSSTKQREESIEGQIRECMGYAEKNNIKIVETYIDRAASASKDTDKRLGFLRMVKDSAKHQFDAVLVWKLDRFARDRYDSAHYKHILKKNGVRVVSATEHIAEGPEGIILESMLEGMAEYYSAELSEKIHRGQKENALKGLNNGGGVPLGYRLNSDSKKLEVDPIMAPVVREIFKRYSSGETIREIKDDLNDRGIRTRKGTEFKYSTFNVLLKNRKYIGEYQYQDVVIPDGVPAIVPLEVFNKVQNIKEKNKHAPGMGKAEIPFLLTTKLFCGECGKLMVGESGTSQTGRRYHYYKCGGAKRKSGCKKKPVRKEWIEDLVIQKTMEVIMDDNLLDRIAKRLLKVQGEENYDIKIIDKRLQEVEKGIENLLNAIQAGIITPSTQKRLVELEEEKERAEQELIQAKIANPALSYEQIMFFLTRFRNLDVTDETQRKHLVDCFVNSIYLYDDKLVLVFNYKENEHKINLIKENSSYLSGEAPPKRKAPSKMVPSFLYCLRVTGLLE